MQEAAQLKPILAAVLLPPAGPLLLAAIGWAMSLRHRRVGNGLLGLGLLGLALLCCQAVAMRLDRALLPQVGPVAPEAIERAQAIVVLGGGVLSEAPEYGAAQPNGYTLRRLRYGARLAKETGLPLAFSGGIGWAAAGMATQPEAEVAARTLAEWGVQARWLEGRSRDTEENARHLRALLAPAGIDRIALVTDAWHLPRAQWQFRRAGFAVIPAPTGFEAPQERPLLQWMPSAAGLTASRQVLREWLALQVAAR